MQTVELRAAYHWNCEDCGTDNYVLPLKAEFAPGEQEEMYRRFNDLEDWQELPDDWEDFEMIMAPDYVTCKHCKTRFATTDERR